MPEVLAREYEKAAEKKPDPLVVLEQAAGNISPISLKSIIRNIKTRQAESGFPDPADPTFTIALAEKFGLNNKTADRFNRCGHNPADESFVQMATQDYIITDLGGDQGVRNILGLFGAVFDVATGAETDLDSALKVLDRVQAEMQK